jgi:hypothetical protein
LVTMIRADVKADDHINANASPIRIARRSIALPVFAKCRLAGRLLRCQW